MYPTQRKAIIGKDDNMLGSVTINIFRVLSRKHQIVGIGFVIKQSDLWGNNRNSGCQILVAMLLESVQV